jgi:hypothetical protein
VLTNIIKKKIIANRVVRKKYYKEDINKSLKFKIAAPDKNA